MVGILKSTAGRVGLLILVIFIGVLYFSNIAIPVFASLGADALRAQPYISKITRDDVELRSLSTSIIKDCPSGDRACEAHRIFRHVTNNFKYVQDPREGEFIQSPRETVKIGGGDCEDLTILLDSMLESVAFKTYMVLGETHSYGLVCGVDQERLQAYVEEDFLRDVAKNVKRTEGTLAYQDGKLYLVQQITLQMSIKPGRTYSWHGELPEGTFSEKEVAYSLESTQPLDIYFLKSKEDYDNMIAHDAYQAYNRCQRKDTASINGSCSMAPRGNVVFANHGQVAADVLVTFNISYAYVSGAFGKNPIKSYLIDGQSCVVMDATSGKFGYLGYDAEKDRGEKMAIDPVTKEIKYIE